MAEEGNSNSFVYEVPDLSKNFHNFFTNDRIFGSPSPQQRIVLNPAMKQQQQPNGDQNQYKSNGAGSQP
mgnify:FL=1